jgi:6-phosphogluconate dehydrogenase
MQIAMVGLGRMGASMVRRLLAGGHECVVFDRKPAVVKALVKEGATGATSMKDLVAKLSPPRAVKESGQHYVDVGTSGGVAGRERGYCLMIGGEKSIVRRLAPLFVTLAPGAASAERTEGRSGKPSAAEQGFLHCGPHGAGHFVKMVHNGIEYGVMAAYSEGLNILKNANVGRVDGATDAETTPLREPRFYRYDLDLSEISEVWRRGSVIASWLLDLTAAALLKDPGVGDYGGRVSDSGEGRWTIEAAIDEGVPANVLSAALYERFGSRGDGDFGHKVLSAMRHSFGGHVEVPARGKS